MIARSRVGMTLEEFANIMACIWFVQLEEGHLPESVAEASGFPVTSIRRRIDRLPCGVKDALRRAVAEARRRAES